MGRPSSDTGSPARLCFYFGTMGCGKSTQALQIHHNLTNRGLSGPLLTQLDRAQGRVSSRIGLSAEAVQVSPTTDLREVVAAHERRHGRVDFVVCDEAQFYEPEQIERLAGLVDHDGVDVYAFGLLTSFQGRLFPGTARLLELADERQELQVESRCWCGARATHNARLEDGTQVYDGELKVVGDTVPVTTDHQSRLALTGGEPEITYELLCRRHWLAGEVAPD